jgi:hypothetical protein
MKTDGSICGDKRSCRPRITFGWTATIPIAFCRSNFSQKSPEIAVGRCINTALLSEYFGSRLWQRILNITGDVAARWWYEVQSCKPETKHDHPSLSKPNDSLTWPFVKTDRPTPNTLSKINEKLSTMGFYLMNFVPIFGHVRTKAESIL